MKEDLILRLTGERKGQVLQVRLTSSGNLIWRRGHEDAIRDAFIHDSWLSLYPSTAEKLAVIRSEFSFLTIAQLRKLEKWFIS